MAKTTKGKKKPAGRKKSAGTGSARKKPAGSAPKRGAAVVAAESSRSRDRSPIYILAIMLLLCVIVVLLNKNYFAGKKGAEPAKKTEAIDAVKKEVQSGTSEKTVKDDKSSDDKKTAESSAAKSEGIDKAETNKSDVTIYLIKYDGKTEKMSLVPMKRRVSSGTPIRGALDELIKGPSKNEESRGLLTAMPENLRIRDVKIENNTAVIDFNEAIEENANGNILLMRVDQIVYTATQFKNIDSVQIKINGKKRGFLGGDGLSIGGPITRRK